MDQQKMYDVVIVGGGAAGLAAAIYTSRRELSTLVISQDIGGQASTTDDIENYPGVDHTDGASLMMKFKTQSEKHGARVVIETVRSITPQDDGNFLVAANTLRVVARAVILAFGLTHKHLDVPGEDIFAGKGVSYCATCDAPLYKKKRVAVIGGGSSAAEAALLLSTIASEVTLINRTDEFRAEQVLLDRIRKTENIHVLVNASAKQIIGSQTVETFLLTDTVTGKEMALSVDGIFVEIGFTVKADWIKDVVATDARNQIVISPNCETSREGIFAAGDVTTIAYKQVVISAGEGAKAALQAYQYLLKKTGKRGARIDWGSKK